MDLFVFDIVLLFFCPVHTLVICARVGPSLLPLLVRAVIRPTRPFFSWILLQGPQDLYNGCKYVCDYGSRKCRTEGHAVHVIA
jgi:hypothetical protein